MYYLKNLNLWNWQPEPIFLTKSLSYCSKVGWKRKQPPKADSLKDKEGVVLEAVGFSLAEKTKRR